MNTLDKEKEIIELLVEKIDAATDKNIKVICTDDYTEERDNYMVVIGIVSTTPCHPQNPFLPDYEYALNILVDCFINEDKQGHYFEKTKGEVLSYLEPYLQNNNRLAQLFEDIPVVAFFFNGITNSSTDQSNKSILNFRVIASY